MKKVVAVQCGFLYHLIMKLTTVQCVSRLVCAAAKDTYYGRRDDALDLLKAALRIMEIEVPEIGEQVSELACFLLQAEEEKQVVLSLVPKGHK